MASTTATRPNLSDFEDEVTVDTIPMSYEAYLTWAEGDEHGRRRGEWVDGEVIPFVTISPRHDRILILLYQVIGVYLDVRGPGRIFGQEFEMTTRPQSAREPDMFVVLGEGLDSFSKMRFEAIADVVVEAISPDSVTRERHHKHTEYVAKRIPEYWLFDPRPGRQRIDLFQLDDAGEYGRAVADSEGRVWSRALPGVWLDPAWFRDAPLPGLVVTGMAMAGVTYRIDPTA